MNVQNTNLIDRLINDLQQNKIDIDDYPTDTCIIWTGRIKNGLPSNAKEKSLRKQIWYARNHTELDGLLTTSCGNKLCLNPNHICYIQSLNTHCPNGHKYTPQNTRWRIRKDKGETKPSRECYTCYKKSKRTRKKNR